MFILLIEFLLNNRSDDDHKGAVRANQGCVACSGWQRADEQPAGAQRGAVCSEAGLQMARAAEAIRALAHSLHADEPVLQERCSRPRIREATDGADRPRQDRGLRPGLDLGEGASGRDWRSKKNGPQCIGKSRGGWNTKIHMVAADARTAITFALSSGNAHDAPQRRELLRDLGPMPEGLPMLMDSTYEGDETRQLVLELGMVPVVPPKFNRIEPWEYDRAL